MEAEQVLQHLETNLEQGLSEGEVQRRLRRYGFNELRREERISPLSLFFRQFKNPLLIILMVAIGLSGLVGEAVDAAIIAVILLFCVLLGFIQEYRADRALEALKRMLTPTITVRREGREKEVTIRELVPGDLLVLEAGDRIPADGRIVENHFLRCDEAALTGESIPVEKEIAPLPEGVRAGDRRNMVFAGTSVTFGRGMAVVTSTGMETELGRIAGQVTSVRAEKTPLERRTEEIGKWLGIGALSVCFLVAAFSILREALTGRVDFPFLVRMAMFTVALAVAAVPEALSAIVTGALAIGMRQMAKKNALIRKMPAVETLGCTTVICTDKTGTLTRGEMTVRRIWAGGRWVEVSGSGYAPQGEMRGSGLLHPEDLPGLRLLLLGGLLCNDSSLEAEEGRWTIKGDPTEGALVVAAVKAGMRQEETRRENPRIEEIPFSSERKRMTTIHQMKDGRRLAFMKGAPEEVLAKCERWMVEGELRPLGEAERAEILKANEEMARDALRVLGFAYKECLEGAGCEIESVEAGMVFLGLAGMIDPPREEAVEAIRVCQQVGIKPVMITGDHRITALAIAKEMGIYREGDSILTGEELERISEEELTERVDRITVYARVSPLDKLKIVKAWKRRGEVVAMTGDGVNDAPALKQADIGVAMGITGTEITKESADMILTDDNFATIVTAIERGRWIYDNIKKYLIYLLESNVVEVTFVGGMVILLGPEYLPILPAAILYINLATDGLPALALGVSPPDPDIMQRPPRDPKESVFTWDVKAFVLMILVVEIPILSFLFLRELSDLTHGRTLIFFFFVITELVIALHLRSTKYSVFTVPPHRWLWIALAWEIVLLLAILQFPRLLATFGIDKPSLEDLWIIFGACAVLTIGMEVVKGLVRRRASFFRKGDSLG
ncbi:MAG: cation-translocating P-type ATPase [Desulfobacterota bacterium]|nr:cation-translocating P-type ATPase [Thermodesulfobacteriota bacterium]